MHNNFKIIRGIIIIVILLLLVIVGYENIKPSALENDIHVKASIRLNDTDNCDHKEYVLDTSMMKDKNCHIILYPYIEGLGMMTYSEIEEEDYFLLNSVGSDGFIEPIAVNALRNSFEVSKNISLTGFWVPDEVGQYKVRTYFDKLDAFEELNNPVLVCVFYEEKFGKQLKWTKIIPITIE
ncbi:MAG: hypothetical protein K0S01_1897 [Herbinix sp.]|jgi:hypothetical protein|nr:hypothetical protein [Herbinix sp.]